MSFFVKFAIGFWIVLVAYVCGIALIRRQFRHRGAMTNPFDSSNAALIKRWYWAHGGEGKANNPVAKLYERLEIITDYVTDPKHHAQALCSSFKATCPPSLTYASSSDALLDHLYGALEPLTRLPEDDRQPLFLLAVGTSLELICQQVGVMLAADVAALKGRADTDREAFSQLVKIYVHPLMTKKVLVNLGIESPEQPQDWNRWVARHFYNPGLSQFVNLHPDPQPGDMLLRAAKATLRRDGVEALIILAHCKESRTWFNEVGPSMRAQLGFAVVKWREEQDRPAHASDDDSSAPS